MQSSFWVNLLEIINREWTVVLTAMLPIFELRGAIPLGFSLGLSPLKSLMLGFAGSMIPVIPIILITGSLLDAMENFSLTRKMSVWMRERTMRRSKEVRRYGIMGLLILVAIPLPYTGVWTGGMVAALLHLPFKKALLAIAGGDLAAGAIVTIISYNLF